MNTLDYVLLPGRHHLLTRYQATWLRRLFQNELCDDAGDALTLSPDASVIWALTSANHTNTRRNPIAANRREAAIEQFGFREQLPSIVVPISDTAPTARFADVTIKSVEASVGIRLHPENTVVACSTPAVASLYRELGYRIAGVEADTVPDQLRPWDVLNLLVDGDENWRTLAHPATIDIYDRYRLGRQIVTVTTDPIVGSEGSLTETRSYGSYARAFEDASDRKWEQIRDHVRPGRIVDVGCATGGLLRRAGNEPRLHESDLIGIEVSRHLFTEAEFAKAQGRFANPNTFFYQRNVLAPDPVFPDRSIDTTLTVALTHEIISYGDGVTDARRLADTIYAHTSPAGVWINSDVCGPDQPDRIVLLELDTTDGATPKHPRQDLDGMTGGQVREYIESLSTYGKFVQFAHDFLRLSGRPFTYDPAGPGTATLRLDAAMEFMTRKDYADNYLSECHESFCTLTYADWVELVTTAGFVVDRSSHSWRNDWLVENRFANCARLYEAGSGRPLDWPTTHLLMIARRPEHT